MQRKKRWDLAVKDAFNDSNCLLVVNLPTVVRIKPINSRLVFTRKLQNLTFFCPEYKNKVHPHFKGPAEFFFWGPRTDEVVDHDELKEVNIPVAISIQSPEC